MRTVIPQRSVRRSRRGMYALALSVALTSLAACKNMLDVAQSARIPADQLETPRNAALLVSGAISDFDCAFGAFVVMGGLISDELDDATETAARWVYDRRDVSSSDAIYATNGCESLGTYTPLNTARESADNALRLLQSWTDEQMAPGVDRTDLMAQAAAFGGYGRVLLGEMFCTAVISRIDSGRTIVYGPEITDQAMWQSADSSFTNAIDLATQAGDDDIRFLALAGRARARLDLGDYAGAQADADNIPNGWVYDAPAATGLSRQHNRVYDESNPISIGGSSVNQEYWHLTNPSIPSMHDPRIPVDSTGDSTAGNKILYFAQTKYPGANSPLPIASYKEAQLISAEGDLRAGRPDLAVDKINNLRRLYLRAGSDTVGDYTGSQDPDSVLALLIEERRRFLFLEGQRLGDVRRYGITLSPPAGTAYRFGGTYGTTTCLPLPDAERQANPNAQTPITPRRTGWVSN